MAMLLSRQDYPRTADVATRLACTNIGPTTQVGAVAGWRYTTRRHQTQSMDISPANLMMFKSFNPLCRYRGLSPLNPAAFAIDQLNGLQPHKLLTCLKTVCNQRLTNNRINSE